MTRRAATHLMFEGDASVALKLYSASFSTSFGWCSDRFGVSWQLNLP